MRIGLVTTWFERGAAYVSRQYRDVLSPAHEVRIYARGGEADARGNPRWDGDDVTWARSIPTHGNTAFDLAHFRRWLRRLRPDVVLFNEQHWWPPVLLCQDEGIRTAAYVDYYTEATVPLFANYDLLLCHTRRHRSVFDWHPACVYLPWGTDLDLFRPSTTGVTGRGVTGRGVTFFHSAGHNPQRKGTDLLIEAFEGLGADARLLIHTQQPIDRRLPELAPRIARLEAEQRLRLHVGDVPAPGLYHRGDVYVYPTRLEGLGLTVPEALASGLPVVIPDADPMTELVSPESARRVAIERLQPREDGYYWPQAICDVGDLRSQLAWFCAHADRLPELRGAARAHAEDRLDWKRNAAELPQLLERTEALSGELRARAREAARRFERQRVDLRLFFPFTTRVMLKLAGLLRPLASRYSGRR